MARNHDARRMRRAVARQALDFLREVDEAADIVAFLIRLAKISRLLHRLCKRHLELVRHELRDVRDLRVRHVERAPDVADRALRRHRAERDNLRDMVVAIALLDVLDDLAALDVVEIDIDIRHRHALRVQKALEQQIVLHRVEIRDAEEIRDNRASRRAAARPDADAMLARVVDEIPDNQEIAVVAHAVDDAELILEAVTDSWRGVGIALGQRLLAEEAQIRLVVLVRRGNRIVRQLQVPELELHVAALRNLHRVLNGLGAVGEKRRHFLRRLQIVVVAVEPHAVRVINRLRHLDAEQDVVELAVLAAHVMAVVRCDKAEAILLRERDETRVRLLFLVQPVVLDFEEIIFLAEDVDVLAHERVGAVGIVRNQRARHLARNAGGQADDALMIFAQQLVIDARLVVEALDIRV